MAETNTARTRWESDCARNRAEYSAEGYCIVVPSDVTDDHFTAARVYSSLRAGEGDRSVDEGNFVVFLGRAERGVRYRYDERATTLGDVYRDGIAPVDRI